MSYGYNILGSTTRISKPVIAGSTKPLENFDPLNLSSEENTPLLREAELKHGRLAMLAAIGIPVAEMMTKTTSIHDFDKLSPGIQLGFVTLMLASETSSMIRGWKNPFEDPSNKYELKENYQPGDYNFGLNYDLESDEGKKLLDIEINNGRLAMIGALGMIVQELVTDKSLF
tara:strand:- start:99 stop:614 length:516 start_codon:yes stop_codon:yes gene_type:complete